MNLNSKFTSILQQSKDNKTIIAIFQDPGSSDFWAGYVVDFNEEYFVMQHITKFGKKDGLLIEPIYKIRRIDKDDYCKCLQYVFENSADLDKEEEVILNIPKEENWVFHTLNVIKGEQDYIVRLAIGNDTRFAGFVTDVTEDDFVLRCIGPDGQDDGDLFFMNDDVTSFRINDLEARRRLMIYHYRQSIDFYNE
ncbi:hypothetical protein [Faecalibacter macacae]|uniref:Uncharacterized protein n=1 Tax=Faecalibacter macacae TaxID=1859289 RepID=A0A3L9M4D0_9FLAO|nr:hypothetical protein [Faecalibacter macacae]RLZ07788.1 hypothetical protein EAH69_11010 [Faecalibacter macacae]